jgi:diguanylate cyclase (GGDEF)-like protein
VVNGNSHKVGSTLFSPRPPAVAVLALVTLVAGVLSLMAARYPLDPHSPVHLDVGIGLYSLVLSCVVWALGPRTPGWVLHVALSSAIVLISVAIAVSVTEYGALATSFAYVWMGLYASYFFAPRQAAAYLVAIAGGFFVGLSVNSLSTPPTMWVLVVSTVLGTSAMLSHLLSALRRLADTDQLTGLLNRRGLRVAAEPMLASAARNGTPMSLIAIDLDGFKAVNDSSGHQAGDQLLRDLAASWRGELRRGDVLGRNGGDEFVLVVSGSAADAEALLARLRRASGSGWSAGVAEQVEGSGYDEMLRAADRALYEQKAVRWSVAGQR